VQNGIDSPLLETEETIAVVLQALDDGVAVSILSGLLDDIQQQKGDVTAQV
jgi:hypothetical protein